MPTAAACALVIFGASGDLAKRKLIPALYELARENLLPQQFALVGFARTEMSDDDYRRECREAVQKFARSKEFNPEAWKRIEQACYYVAGAGLWRPPPRTIGSRQSCVNSTARTALREIVCSISLRPPNTLRADHRLPWSAQAGLPRRRRQGMGTHHHREAVRKRPGEREETERAASQVFR